MMIIKILFAVMVISTIAYSLLALRTNNQRSTALTRGVEQSLENEMYVYIFVALLCVVAAGCLLYTFGGFWYR